MREAILEGAVRPETLGRRAPKSETRARSLARSALARTALSVTGPMLLVVALGTVSLMSWDRWQLGAALLFVQSIPLVARDRFPATVLAVTAAGTVAQALVGLPPSNAFMGQAVAMVAVVRRMAWPRSVAVPCLLLLVNGSVMVATGAAEVGRLILIYAMTFGGAWALGDAASRRATVSEALEREITSETRTAALRSDLGAAAERLRIAKELQALAGAGLRRIIGEAENARQLGHEGPAGATARIEATARGVLADLDRFLSLLRRRPPVAGRPVDATPATVGSALASHTRFGPLQQYVELGTLVAPTVLLAVLIIVDGLSLEAGAWPSTGWLVLYAAAAALPLLMRRRRPALVLGAVAIASAVPLAMEIPIADGPLGIVVAVHAVAAYRSRSMALALGGLAVVVITALATLLSAAYAMQLGTLTLIFTMVGAYVGDTSRLARAHDASLADRLRSAQEQSRLAELGAVADERARAARDLHDSVGHAMSLIILQAGAVRLGLARDGRVSPESEEAVSAIHAVAQGALTQLDGMFSRDDEHGDRSVAPGDNEQLGVALERLANDVRRAGVPTDLTVGALGDVPASFHAAIVRLVQEALTNVLKHAPGACAVVAVARADDMVAVDVTNTRGAPTRDGQMPSGLRGLAGMRERVALFNGSLECGTSRDGGFAVHVRLPVPQPISPTTMTTGALT